MKRLSTTNRYVLGVFTIAVICLIALVLLKDLERSANPKLSSEVSRLKLASLVSRCQVSMQQNTCSVMKGSQPQGGQNRLFIAGIGEVDAQAFSRLKEAGDAMCNEVEQQCKTDWGGQSCRIALAMYPVQN
jgi:hypothetical protein